MSMHVLVEPLSDGSGYRASTGAPLDLAATGQTPEEALGEVGRLIAARVQQGARIYPVPVPVPGMASDIGQILAHAGPRIPEEERRLWREGVDEYRRQRDEELRRQYGLTEPLVME
jgi:hypothetical protein